MSRDVPVPDSSILYGNPSSSILVMDIPLSIALAQVGEKGGFLRRPLSCPPLTESYPSNEPKSDAARAKLQCSEEEVRISQTIQKLIYDALSEIRAGYEGDWCTSRYVESDQEGTPIDRRLWSMPAAGMPPLVLSSHLNQVSSYDDIYANLVCNATGKPTSLKVEKDTFLVPPHSHFLLSRIELAQPMFTQIARIFLPDTDFQRAGEFDFILLDPPWANRSVRRSRTYVTAEHHTYDPWVTASKLLGDHLAPYGLVGVWVTNKPSVRKAVLGTFRELGISLIETWIWVKVTARGEPILPLDALWRKPYETLLLGRKDPDIVRLKEAVHEFLDAPKLVIAAVPDLHSRKPCVKELIESRLPRGKSNRILEVFARYLTAGWWSWGDEVLKYNIEGSWEPLIS
jgi:N6-adenosine-specific RNA methylase IME4